MIETIVEFPKKAIVHLETLFCKEGIFSWQNIWSRLIIGGKRRKNIHFLGELLSWVSSPSEVRGLIPAFSTCFVYVVPWVPGGEADNKQV